MIRICILLHILENGRESAKDPVKDQTDFLAQIDYLQVSKLLFPIGGLMTYDRKEMKVEPERIRKINQKLCNALGK